MKDLRKTISEEIHKLVEDKYPMPIEIQNALEVKLKMSPIIRYVDYLKAVNSIPPSYEINLHNGRKFLIFYEDFSLMVKIEGREYYLMDMEERSNAIEHINRLLVTNNVEPLEPEEGGDEKDSGENTGGDTGGGADDVAMEPEDEPEPEEPADEEPAA
tara:strand:+ start:125 stop:598 length:474 start_codon:yes stop_codon:yes gene_type:complete